MRSFVLMARKASTAPFPLNDLPGAGRIDVVCRCVNASIWLSDTIRRDTEFFSCFDGPPSPPVCIKFSGELMQGVSPDERNIASWISKAVLAGAGEEWKAIQRGIFTAKRNLQSLSKEMQGSFCVLSERGDDMRTAEIGENPVFFLGDHLGIPEKDEGFLERLGAKKISIGPKTYLASHCIAVVNNELDRRGI